MGCSNEKTARITPLEEVDSSVVLRNKKSKNAKKYNNMISDHKSPDSKRQKKHDDSKSKNSVNNLNVPVQHKGNKKEKDSLMASIFNSMLFKSQKQMAAKKNSTEKLTCLIGEYFNSINQIDFANISGNNMDNYDLIYTKERETNTYTVHYKPKYGQGHKKPMYFEGYDGDFDHYTAHQKKGEFIPNYESVNFDGLKNFEFEELNPLQVIRKHLKKKSRL